MKTELAFIRKHDGKEYKFFTNIPSYPGEKGVCGVEITPYVTVTTPANCFGYEDTVLLSSNNKAYTTERYLPKWILKRIEKQMITLQKKLESEVA